MGEEDTTEECLEHNNTFENENKSKRMKISTPSLEWQSVDLPFATEPNWEQPEWIQNSYSPVELFEMFFDDEVIEATSGYCNVPSLKSNVKKYTEDLLKYSHICDNLTFDENDKFGKVCSLWLLLNKRWLRAFPKDSNLLIDEAMIPYYGHHVQEESYQGASTGNTHPELGVGGSVVIGLVDKLPLGQYSIYTYRDNLFTSIHLMDRGPYCTGTIRSSRIEKAPLEESFTLKKKIRGSYFQMRDTSSGITLIQYHDNNIVTIASTLQGATPICKARSDIRLDGFKCVIVKSMTQVRCGECHKNITVKCKKCNVGCHVHCSEKCHSRQMTACKTCI
ncbi:unnamed protein product [Timema podura]|uniref:PiggyBac transposable element-derived protein domain-containing protein n=1 Tax=Timema podura TaxID=61482 RepID=A0ABN7PS98_TIMPD|nr:unnamed protein product [Timema podura]